MRLCTLALLLLCSCYTLRVHVPEKKGTPESYTTDAVLVRVRDAEQRARNAMTDPGRSDEEVHNAELVFSYLEELEEALDPAPYRLPPCDQTVGPCRER